MSNTQEMIVAEQQTLLAPARRVDSDTRSLAMDAPPAQMLMALGQFEERRRTFRDWLASQLIEGVHFGYSPGCTPKWATSNGQECSEDNATGTLSWDNKKSKYNFMPFSSWRPKQSLYAAGADFICDLMMLRCVYEADLDGWKQLGSKEGMFVYVCRLINKGGEVLAEGRGARRVGQKGGDENNAIKMAMKSSKVCAVLDGYGLRDLFTQDDPPNRLDPTQNPEADENAPNAPPRSDRPQRPSKPLASEESASLWRAYVARYPYDKAKKDQQEIAIAQFREFIESITGRQFDFKVSENWKAGEFDQCMQALKENK